jgi:RimJ/RimL family protein N-acetyltransferase
MKAYVMTALDDFRKGTALPFVIIDQSSDEVIGSTRYVCIDMTDRRLEIGWTWIAPAFQRTAANTESKLLLLNSCFRKTANESLTAFIPSLPETNLPQTEDYEASTEAGAVRCGALVAGRA